MKLLSETKSEAFFWLSILLIFFKSFNLSFNLYKKRVFSIKLFGLNLIRTEAQHESKNLQEVQIEVNVSISLILHDFFFQNCLNVNFT